MPDIAENRGARAYLATLRRTDPSPDVLTVIEQIEQELDAEDRAAEALKVKRYTRYWPDGSYCPAGRTHVAWTQIQTTASAEQVEVAGTEGPITWCGCGAYGFVASTTPLDA